MPLHTTCRTWTSLAAAALLAAGCTTDAPVTPTEVPTTPPETFTSLRRSFPEAPRTRGEVREGYVINAWGRTLRVRYEVHDGLALWQGDIELGRADEISATREGARPFMRHDDRDVVAARLGAEQTNAGVIIDGGGFRWPGGVVPYEIQGGLPSQDRITSAIRLIEDSTGGVTLVPRNGQADFVRFVTSDGCSSRVGRQGGMQEIKLADDCSTGSTTHEILHALGVFHEQSRCDRDSRVDIQWANVEAGREGNFDMECDGATDIGDYDFGSLMHYGLDAFSKNGQPTIKLRPGITYSGTIGQRNELSVSDEFTVGFMYGLNNKPPVAVIAPWTGTYFEGDSIPMDASGSTDADDTYRTFSWNFGDNRCGGSPDPPACRQMTGKHAYFDDNTYKVGLFVFDGYSLGSTEAFVTVRNYIPNNFLGLSHTIDEGTLYRTLNSFDDPGDDPWSATVDYGDGGGKTTLPLSNKTFTLNHTYVDNGVFSLRVEITDDDDTGVGINTVTVRNLAPVVSAGPDQVIESGQPLVLTGSFSDAGLMDNPWSWSVNWGNGSNAMGSTNTQGALVVNNQACAAGTYNVTLSVTDKDGGVGSDAAQVTVTFVAATLDITPGTTPNPVSLRNKGVLPVALLSSATFDATTVDVASIRLGNESGVETPVATLKGKYLARSEDANGDGLLDLVLQFRIPDLINNGDLTSSSTMLAIRGFQGAASGSCVNFRGADNVVIVP